MTTDEHDQAGASADASAIRAVQAALAGHAPDGDDVAKLTGEVRNCLDALLEALHSGGTRAVHHAFNALVRDRPWLGALAAQQPPDVTPHDQLRDEQARRGPGKRRASAQTCHLVPKELETARVLEYLEMNEYGDALYFAEVFAGQVCYDHTEKEWYLWAGHYWKRDTLGKVRQLVAGVLGSLYLRACADLNTVQAEVDLQLQALLKQGVKNDEQVGTLKDAYKRLATQMAALRERATALRSARRNANVLSFVQSELGITSDQWDTNQWALATPSGVIDLHTGTCRPGQPTDYIRTVAPTEWAGLEAPCQRFEQFLCEVFEDKPDRNMLIAFLQRLFGYGITGATTEHIFPILYGEEGRNGKDTLLSTLESVLGPLAGAVSNDVFIASDRFRSGGAATPHLCDLQGKRLVWGSETKEGDKLNIAQIKLLTGGGAISVRALYGKQYTFTPTHKLVLMTNYKPHADARDKAFWSRACLVEFGVRFVDTPQAANERKADHELKASLIRERSGILAWLVRGCLEWQRCGLTIPPLILLATSRYRDEEDRLLLFIEECCVVAAQAAVGANELYAAYKAWCKDNQLGSLNGTLFGLEMAKRFEKKRTKTRLIYQGIGLLAADIPPGASSPREEDLQV